MITVKDIIEALGNYSSAVRVEKSQTMYPTSMEVMGVPNPDVKKVLQVICASMKSSKDEDKFAISAKLIKVNIIECQMLAWFILEKFKLVNKIEKANLDLYKGVLDNWVSVDTFGVIIYGILWRYGTIKDEEVIKLCSSEDLWIRRLALVATVALNLRSRGGNGDAARTLIICEHAVDDHHDMIVKALSWALRSLIIWDKIAVQSFLEIHQEKLHKRVLREVNHKLQHGTKN